MSFTKVVLPTCLGPNTTMAGKAFRNFSIAGCKALCIIFQRYYLPCKSQIGFGIYKDDRNEAFSVRQPLWA
jgi:hypothetical protein